MNASMGQQPPLYAFVLAQIVLEPYYLAAGCEQSGGERKLGSQLKQLALRLTRRKLWNDQNATVGHYSPNRVDLFIS